MTNDEIVHLASRAGLQLSVFVEKYPVLAGQLAKFVSLVEQKLIVDSMQTESFAEVVEVSVLPDDNGMFVSTITSRERPSVGAELYVRPFLQRVPPIMDVK